MEDDKIETIKMLLIADESNNALEIILNYFKKSKNNLGYYNGYPKTVTLQINEKKVKLIIYYLDIDIGAKNIDNYLKENKFQVIAYVYNINNISSLYEILTEELKDIEKKYPQIIKAYVGFNSDNGENEKSKKEDIDNFEPKDQHIHYVVNTEDVSTLENFFIGITKKALENNLSGLRREEVEEKEKEKKVKYQIGKVDEIFLEEQPLEINKIKLKQIKNKPKNKKKSHDDESDKGQDVDLNKDESRKEGKCEKCCDCCLIY